MTLTLLQQHCQFNFIIFFLFVIFCLRFKVNALVFFYYYCWSFLIFFYFFLIEILIGIFFFLLKDLFCFLCFQFIFCDRNFLPLKRPLAPTKLRRMIFVWVFFKNIYVANAVFIHSYVSFKKGECVKFKTQKNK